MEVKIAGITFAVNNDPALALARPSGKVEIKHEPFVHPKTSKLNDDEALRVYWDGKPIGYVPKAGPERKVIWDFKKETGKFPEAFVDDYSYSTNGNDFNHDHNGILSSVLLDVHVDAVEDDGNFEFYEKDGEKYKRVSNVMESFDADGGKAIDGSITRWMINTFSSFEEYMTYMNDAADKGTVGHKGIEISCDKGVIGATSQKTIEDAVSCIPKDEFDKVPIGFWNFVSEHTQGMERIGTEETVYDGTCMVAGTYDFFGRRGAKRILIDWKTSKQVRLEHIIKTCFYGHLKGADEIWVLAFGSKNKCGYQLKKVIGKQYIEMGYEIVRCVAKAKDLTESLVSAMKGMK